MKLSTSVSLVLLGGMANTLSIVRSMGALGVAVYVIAPANCPARHSKYLRKSWISPEPGNQQKAFYKKILLEEPVAALSGAVVIPCSDFGIEFIAENHNLLLQQYKLEPAGLKQRTLMLDKLETIDLAREAGCDAPKFWHIDKSEDLDSIRSEILFPVLIKPVHTHQFSQLFGKKMLLANDWQELKDHANCAWQAKQNFIVCEYIPGPDSQLSSCYTYIDKHGHEHFQFTKRIIRRSPKNFGGACCHITDHVPETAEAAMKFFRYANFRGIGNIEFKRDMRDGKLKFIECNARPTAAQEHLFQSGIDLAQIVYRDLTNQAKLTIGDYRQKLLYWEPLKDVRALRQLLKLREITLLEWVKTLLRPLVFPYFRFSDPKPFIAKVFYRQNSN
jgi:predicted ATP-grasp superfamily ATP-dependent carboligase